MFKYFFCSILFSLDSSCIYVRLFDVVPQNTEALLTFYRFFFFFVLSVLWIGYFLSICLQVHWPFHCFQSAVKSISELLVLDCVLFSSRIYIWLFKNTFSFCRDFHLFIITIFSLQSLNTFIIAPSRSLFVNSNIWIILGSFSIDCFFSSRWVSISCFFTCVVIFFYCMLDIANVLLQGIWIISTSFKTELTFVLVDSGVTGRSFRSCQVWCYYLLGWIYFSFKFSLRECCSGPYPPRSGLSASQPNAWGA